MLWYIVYYHSCTNYTNINTSMLFVVISQIQCTFIKGLFQVMYRSYGIKCYHTNWDCWGASAAPG